VRVHYPGGTGFFQNNTTNTKGLMESPAPINYASTLEVDFA